VDLQQLLLFIIKCFALNRWNSAPKIQKPSWYFARNQIDLLLLSNRNFCPEKREWISYTEPFWTPPSIPLADLLVLQEWICNFQLVILVLPLGQHSGQRKWLDDAAGIIPIPFDVDGGNLSEKVFCAAIYFPKCSFEIDSISQRIGKLINPQGKPEVGLGVWRPLFSPPLRTLKLLLIIDTESSPVEAMTVNLWIFPLWQNLWATSWPMLREIGSPKVPSEFDKLGLSGYKFSKPLLLIQNKAIFSPSTSNH